MSKDAKQTKLSLKDYMTSIETMKKEIEGCKNLREFYMQKQCELEKALDKMLNSPVEFISILE